MEQLPEVKGSTSAAERNEVKMEKQVKTGKDGKVFLPH
jgi:hypothetical protein